MQSLAVLMALSTLTNVFPSHTSTSVGRKRGGIACPLDGWMPLELTLRLHPRPPKTQPSSNSKESLPPVRVELTSFHFDKARAR